MYYTKLLYTCQYFYALFYTFTHFYTLLCTLISTMKFMIYGVFTFTYKYAGHKPCPLSRPQKYSGLHYIILRFWLHNQRIGVASHSPKTSYFKYVAIRNREEQCHSRWFLSGQEQTINCVRNCLLQAFRLKIVYSLWTHPYLKLDLGFPLLIGGLVFPQTYT